MAHKKKATRAGSQTHRNNNIESTPGGRVKTNAVPSWRSDLLIDIYLAQSSGDKLVDDSFWLLMAGVNFKIDTTTNDSVALFFTQQVNPKVNPVLTPFDTIRMFMVFPGIDDIDVKSGRAINLVPGGHVGLAQFSINEERIDQKHIALDDDYAGPLTMKQLAMVAHKAQALTKILSGGRYEKHQA